LPRRFFGLLGAALPGAMLALGMASSGRAAVPAPPDQVAYSGVLVDGGGVPLAGPVDLTARLYDAASGGTLIFKQSFTGVALSDGHYTLSLGPTGAATDSPTDPLTASLRTGLTGDLAAGAGRFVEITVDTDPALARVALVLVPYAMRADHATTSDVATNTLDAQALTGLPGGVLTELFEHYNEDGGPPAADPSEGTGDTDNDGELNFVDPDNDNDALSDSAEVGAGSDINLVTPSISTVTPNGGEGDQVTPVTVTGNGFLSGMSAQLGSQVLTPTGLTFTSFDADVGPQTGPYPAARNLTLTNTNGESSMAAGAFTFTFGLTAPVLTSVTPSSGEADEVTHITVAGSGFLPGLSAELGGVPLTITNLTAGSFEADAGPSALHPIFVDLTATNTNGLSDTLAEAFTFLVPGGLTTTPLPFTLAAATLPVGVVARGDELLVFGTQGGIQNRYGVDTLINGVIAFDTVVNLNNNLGPSAVSWNASGVVHGLRGFGSTDQVQLLRDTNGDEFLANTEALAIESPGVDPKPRAPVLLFDGSGRPGGAYLRLVAGTATAMAFHDRDGNGVFTGPNEVVTIEPVGGSTDHLGDGAFDPSGRLAYVYYDTVSQQVRVAHDRSADGDFGDSPAGVPELATAATPGLASLPCLDMSFDGAGRLAILYLIGGNPTLLYDRNGDADFLDANESAVLPGSGTSSGCDLGTSAASGRLLIVHNPGNELRLLVDVNDDGDFADLSEITPLGSPIAAPLGVTTTATGAVRVLAPQGVVSGPVR